MSLWLIFIQWPILGIMSIAWGIRSLQQRQSLSIVQQRRWEKLLKAWNIALPENEILQTLQDIHAAWNTLTSWGWMGLGIAMTVVGTLRIFQLLFTTGSQIRMVSLVEEPALELQLVSLLLGYSMVHLYGFWRLRKESLDRVRYADLRPRRLTDYHALVVQSLPIGNLLYLILLLLVSMPYWKAQISIPLISGATLTAPSWIAWIVPCFMILVVLVTEAWLWQVATFPRLLVGTDSEPSLSAAIDDILRSLVSMQILSLEYVTVGILDSVQIRFLALNRDTPSDIQTMLLICMQLPGLLFVAGIALGLLKGQLGGKMTGGPWQYAKYRRKEQAIAENEPLS